MTNAPGGAGNIGLAAIHDSSGIEVFYQTGNVGGNHIIELFWNGSWTYQDRGAAAQPGTPLSAITNSNGEHVYYVDQFGFLDELKYKGTWTNQILYTGSMPQMKQISSFANGSTSEHVYFTSGTVYELYYNGSSWTTNNLSGLTGGSPAYNPSGIAAIYDKNGSEVFYINSDDTTHQIYWDVHNGLWYDQTLPGGYVTGGPFLTGFANNNGEHFYYVTQCSCESYARINELYFNYGNNTWNHYDTSGQTGVFAENGTNLTSFSNSNGQHVYFFGNDNKLWEFYYATNGSAWSPSNLFDQTGTPAENPGAVALTSFSF